MIYLLSALPDLVFAQNTTNHLQWSATRKLTVEDFLIKTKSLETTSSFAQFSFDFQVNGFDFMTKNFNKKVKNYIIKSASWIDTTVNVSQVLVYQQTLFDLSEIYARKLRKALRENRKKIANGTQIVKELNDTIMTSFAERRVSYDRETNFGADWIRQKEWEVQIQKELLELNDFAYEN